SLLGCSSPFEHADRISAEAKQRATNHHSFWTVWFFMCSFWLPQDLIRHASHVRGAQSLNAMRFWSPAINFTPVYVIGRGTFKARKGYVRNVWKRAQHFQCDPATLFGTEFQVSDGY